MSPSLYGSCNQPTNTTLSSFGPQRTWKEKKKEPHLSLTIFNGNWTEWNPVRSGIIRKTDIKIGRTQTGGTFVNHENNFRQYFYDGKAVTNFSKQGHLLRNNTYQLNVFRTNIYSCFFFPMKEWSDLLVIFICRIRFNSILSPLYSLGLQTSYQVLLPILWSHHSPCRRQQSQGNTWKQAVHPSHPWTQIYFPWNKIKIDQSEIKTFTK